MQRKTFVLWLSGEGTVTTGGSPVLEGRLEDVDSGWERRFRSAEQLLALLEEGLSKNENQGTSK